MQDRFLCRIGGLGGGFPFCIICTPFPKGADGYLYWASCSISHWNGLQDTILAKMTKTYNNSCFCFILQKCTEMFLCDSFCNAFQAVYALIKGSLSFLSPCGDICSTGMPGVLCQTTINLMRHQSHTDLSEIHLPLFPN